MTIGRGVAVLAVGAALVLAGCDSDPLSDLPPIDTTSTVGSELPTGFDPCTDIPENVLDAANLKLPMTENSNGANGIKWRGCIYVPSDSGYGANIQITNITVSMVREKGFADIREFTVGGRKAISARQIPERLKYSCTVNVEMRNGSLQISITNPPTSNTVGRDTCEIARELAESIAPSLPVSG